MRSAELARPSGCKQATWVGRSARGPLAARAVTVCLPTCVQAGQETAAAFLETQRVAALKGATSEFEKLEGFTFGE